MNESIRDPGPLLTYQESTKRALEKIQRSPNLWTARVRYSDWSEVGFELCYDSRTKKIPESLPCDMVDYPWPKFHKDIIATGLIAEIYSSNPRSSLVVRLIRRGLRGDDSGLGYDLAEWFFRLAREPVSYYSGGKYGPNGPERHVDAATLSPIFPNKCFIRMPTPAELLELVRCSWRVWATIPGGRVDIRMFQWNGEPVHVGQKKRQVA